MPREQGLNTNQGLCVEVCKTHHAEKVRHYCNDHEEPGCGDCMNLNHKYCNTDRVQDISHEYQATNEPDLIQQKLDEFHNKLEEMKDALDDNFKNLDTTYNNIQHQITSFRKHINDYLDHIQKQITDKAAEMKQIHETEIKKLIAKNKSMNFELEDIIQKKHTAKNVNSIFVITKQAKQKLGKMKNEITKVEESQQQLQQELRHQLFRPSDEIEKLVSANPPLGELLRKPNVNTRATYKGTISVNYKNDQGYCQMNDCTLLWPDTMVVTDNKNIKLIDISNKKVISSYKTSVPPCGVTAVSTDLVAVTLPDRRKVQLLKVASTFTKQDKIQVNRDCCGIAYKDRKFAVTYRDPDKVEILNIYGEALHTIHGKEDIFGFPGSITFGQEKDTVIVAAGSEVSVVTFTGKNLRTYTHRGLVSGITITPDGVLFVCSQGSESVHAVSPDFKRSKTIINTEGYPNSISYCDINHRLYITNRYSGVNAIKQYDLNV